MFMVSSGQHQVQFIQQREQFVAEQQMRFAESAALVERGEFKILRVNAQAGGDVVADEIEPGELVGTKRHASFGLVHEPFVEARGDGGSEGFEHGLLLQRKADERDEVGEAMEQQPVLEPFAESVTTRFNEWLMTKAQTGTVFTADQLAWLNLIRDHIATSLSIDPEDFEFAPFNQRGGLGKAHQLFGEQLPQLLDELNQVLAA